jgi:hypothetical protein
MKREQEGNKEEWQETVKVVMEVNGNYMNIKSERKEIIN